MGRAGARRSLALLLTGALVVVAGVVGGRAVLAPDEDRAPATAAVPSASSPAPLALPSGLPVRPALLDDLPDSAPLPTAAGLQAAVDAALADPALGGRLAVSVVDVETGEPLLERAADSSLIPASTAKIVTAVAALTALDPDARLRTRVVAGPEPGDVVLVGGGDPTLAGPGAPADYPEPARLTELADQVRAALGGVPVTRVLVDTSLYAGDQLGPGWRPSYVGQGVVAPVVPLMVDGGRLRPEGRSRHADPALAAGLALAELLAPGAAVPVQSGTAPAGAVVLGAVQSPTVPQLVERMLARSDNDLAEALLRHVAIAQGRPASFAGGAAAVESLLGPYLEQAGVGAGAVALVDGSGLSRLDAVQPAALTRLLARVAADDGSPTADRLAPVLTGLPVAGFTGTLADRYREGEGRPAAGVVRAKTGTLSGVSALAGLVRTADGRLLAFDLTTDAVPPGATLEAEAALDALAGALAACGCR